MLWISIGLLLWITVVLVVCCAELGTTALDAMDRAAAPVVDSGPPTTRLRTDRHLSTIQSILPVNHEITLSNVDLIPLMT